MPDAKAGSRTPEPKDHTHAVKETLISIAISFVMAFVFRGFVIEGFQIPTGSMAPTLLGKHMLIEDPADGYAWSVGPWDYIGGSAEHNPNPTPRQGGQRLSRDRTTPPVKVNNPITGAELIREDQPTRAGDRIFVIKYLEGLHDPERWDVLVFKNPSTRENYIKRLVGLPDEQVALVDGDVFARPFVQGQTATAGLDAWTSDGWQVQRKSERTQREMFQPVYDARYNPVNPGPEHRSPWVPDAPAMWQGLRDRQEQTFEGTGATTLAWSDAFEITDWYPYNQNPTSVQFARDQLPVLYPVSDIAVSLSFEPGDGAASAAVSPTIRARGREFRARVASGSAVIELRELDPDTAGTLGEPGPWVQVDTGESPAFGAGTPVDIEFWHVDQALWLFVDGDLVAGGPPKGEDTRGAYEMGPADRVLASTGEPLAELLERPGLSDARIGPSVLADPTLYRKPGLSWSFTGGPFTIRRMTVKRDIHYQLSPGGMRRLQPTFGSDPAYFPTLGPDQFFVCGDNSPSSKDGRLWTKHDGGPDPWVATQFDDSVGTLDRDLIVGRAFIVYFPAPLRAGRLPIPDTGRVRWIW